MTTFSLLFVFPIPIGGSPKNLAFATTDFAHPTPAIKISVFWREFVTALAVSQTAKVVVLSVWKHCFSYVRRVRQDLQMLWIAAVLYFAQMMKFQSFWNESSEDLINHAVNIFSPPIDKNNSIASHGMRSRPEPASCGLNGNPFLNTNLKV